MSRPIPNPLLGFLACVGMAAGCSAPAVAPAPDAVLPGGRQSLTVHAEAGRQRADIIGSTVAFDRGACLVAGRGATAVAVGTNALLLADLAGPNNRCELLLQRQQEFVLYERIGQRPLAVADAQRIAAPVGVGAQASTEHVGARFDLFLQRSDRATDDPIEQRWPRSLRLRGVLRLPRVDPGGPPGSAIRDLESLLSSSPHRLHQHLTNQLPALRRPLLPQLAPGPSQELPRPPPAPTSPAGGDRPEPPEADQHRSS